MNARPDPKSCVEMIAEEGKYFMQYYKNQFLLMVFTLCLVMLLFVAPWVQVWMAQLGLMYAPYDYLLNADVHLLICRTPGVLVWVVLGIFFYLVNLKFCKILATRFSLMVFRTFFCGSITIIFALTLPAVHILLHPIALILYDHMSVASVCSRQSSYYWNLWVYSGASYLFSALFSLLVLLLLRQFKMVFSSSYRC